MPKISAVIGIAFGDEGKGKIVDLIAPMYDICARAQGGSNAGHTVKINGQTFKLHLIPSGILTPNVICLIGNGCVIHLEKLKKEITDLENLGIRVRSRLFISSSAHIVQDEYIQEDVSRDLKSGIGSTKQGIGPTYAHKMYRDSLRFETLKNDPYWKDLVIDSTHFLFNAYDKSILIEGANATMLDIDLGTYPFVTSSNTTIGGLLTGLGIPFHNFNMIIGVFKAYLTRVGHGIMPTELTGKMCAYIQEKGQEYGTTTNRLRRCGWIDLSQMRYACFINGIMGLAINKLDVLTGLLEVKVCTHYEHLDDPNRVLFMWPNDWSILKDYKPVYETFKSWSDISKCKTFDELPIEAKNYITFLEKELTIPVVFIGTGPERTDIILKPF